MPYANSDYTHLMLEHINEEYDEDLMKHILSLSSVHKLSYKLTNEAYVNKRNFYNRIVVNNLGNISSITQKQVSLKRIIKELNLFYQHMKGINI